MAKITRINPDGISKPFSNYSHVVTAEGAQRSTVSTRSSPSSGNKRSGPPAGDGRERGHARAEARSGGREWSPRARCPGAVSTYLLMLCAR